MNRQILIAGGAASFFMVPNVSHAHIKWFCSYDTTVPPLSPTDVVTPVFAFVAVWFGTMMFLAYFLDRIVDRNGWLDGIQNFLKRCAPAIPFLVRGAVGIFF